jgi:hypothetical protein
MQLVFHFIDNSKQDEMFINKALFVVLVAYLKVSFVVGMYFGL